ncbi:MAG: FecR domain-containing protein [Chitinophagaceae bacterium]|nr:FecR domain-containing protein [Chitinophagaceae bacterium]
MPSDKQINYFNTLLAKYLDHKASPEEIDFIEKYYQYFDRNKNLTDDFTDAEMKETELRMLNNLKTGISGANKKVRPLYSSWWKWAAASVAVVLAGGIIFSQLNRQPGKVISEVKAGSSESHDIAPGTDKAIITLDDGTSVFLDDSSTGVIARQGSTQVFKLSSGEVVYRNGKDDDEVVINTMTTPRGGRYQLTLADGTKVWMNSASSISYPTAFAGKERRVKVTGEVYFEVSKNAQKPFYVGINDETEIRVLGTHFNVNTYADNGSINTTLLEGSVSVSNNAKELLLKPGQQAEIKNRAILLLNNVDTARVMAWKNGYFSFNNTDLEMIMKQLARWYDIEVEYEGQAPLMKFWGGISMNSTLSQVLQVLEESKIRFRIEDKRIVVLNK